LQTDYVTDAVLESAADKKWVKVRSAGRAPARGGADAVANG
jgi:hypothetical protein